jgi:hypothetical protein
MDGADLMSLTEADPNAKPSSTADWTPTEYDLRDTWFAIAHARDVGAQPTRRILHAQTCYLWREDGVIKACEFNPGRTAGDRAEPSAFTDGSGYYPVVEQYGYAWLWYGNPDRADVALLPHIPFLPRDGDVPAYMRNTVRFDACMALSVENLLDLTHADFLHGEVLGGEGKSDSDAVSFEFTSETLTRVRMVTGRPISPVMRWVGGVRGKFQDFRSTLHVHLRSGTCISYPRFRPGFDIPNVQPFVPAGKRLSLVNQAFNLTGAPTPFRQIMPRMAHTIAPQDNMVMRPQNPRYDRPSERRDLHSRFDTPGNRYRFLMQQLWERQRAGDFSYLSDAEPGGDIAAALGLDAQARSLV